MSIFEDLSNSKSQGRGLKITEPALGADLNYVVQVDSIKLQESNNDLGTLFIVEFTVLEGSELNPPGAARSWVQFPTNRKQTDPGNIKLFVAALLGMTGSDPAVPAEAFKKAAEGGFDGTTLRLNVAHVRTKAGRDFFAHSWAPFSGDVAALQASQPSASAAPPAVPAVPTVPMVPAVLTRERWLAGEGPGTVHPTNPAYEWSPEHSDWGVRPKA